jgi:NAD(P)-dependent dehydrogenase (short-subunit alcohol dehydrogenase family)
MPSLASGSPVVLVTGAAKRLGREIALTLARAGWRVAVHYRDSTEDAIKTAADCEALTAGATRFDANFDAEDHVKALVPRVVAKLGRLDAVVNSASSFLHDDANTFSYALLEQLMRSNTGAAIILARSLHTHLQARSATGAVVNLLDQKLWNPNPDFLSYTLSKAALECANTVLAQAFAPTLRVVGVAPGLTLTSHLLSEAKFQALHKLSPLGRASTPQDVCATVKFALENQSITGTTLLVDGGQHLMRFERDFSMM